MASFDLTVRSDGNRITADEPADCRGSPAEGHRHAFANAMGTEAGKDGPEHEVRKSGEKNQKPLIEDSHLLELVELQRRLFQSM